MAQVRVIDADTHVDETDATWDYLEGDDVQFKPDTSFPSHFDPARPIRYWVIDGHRKHRRIREDGKSRTTLETRELQDVAARLRHMDELGTEVQVIYPSLFLVEPTTRGEVELALTRSYNRWLADKCEQSKGRLRWVMVPSASNPETWTDELQFAIDHGACGVLKKGDQEAGKWPADPYFFPLYQEAERHNLPLCFHLGGGTPDFTSAKELPYRGLATTTPAINGIFSLITNGVPSKFPNLRFGCIEAGASWVPWVAYMLRRRAERFDTGNVRTGSAPTYDVTSDVFKQNHIYVTCQIDEDLPYILSHMSEDLLMAGSDYTHQDQSQELLFAEQLLARASSGDISETVAHKIMYDNPKAFYGL